MADNLRARMDDMLSKRFRKTSDQLSDLDDRRRMENADLRKFFDLREHVIRPKVLEFISLLRERGVYSRISTDEPFRLETGQKTRSTNITFWIYDVGQSTDNSSDYTTYCIRWDAINGQVKFSTQNVRNNKHGLLEYDYPCMVYDVTSDLIEDNVFNFTRSTLNK